MRRINMAMNRAAYRAARLRVLHVKRDHLAETKERYEAFLASTSDDEAGCRH